MLCEVLMRLRCSRIRKLVIFVQLLISGNFLLSRANSQSLPLVVDELAFSSTALDCSTATRLHTIKDAVTKKTGSWFSLPAVIEIGISTPREYLSDRRDDFEVSGRRAEYAEYSFALSMTDKEELQLEHTSSIDVGTKPIYEDRGAQLYVSRQLHDSALESNLIDIQADIGRIDMTYGLRYQRIYDQFQWWGYGGILGRTWADTQVFNDLIGPQVAVLWTKERFGCRFNLDSKLMLGTNMLLASQSGGIGENLAPGAQSRPAAAQPNLTYTVLNESNSATLSELRASIAYPLARDLMLRLGYTGIYFSHLHNPSSMQRWSLPDLGITSDRTRNLWFDQIHASVEWRR